MFTGLIEDIGQIKDIKELNSGKLITVQTAIDTKDVKIGDSIAINGACQTVLSKEDKLLSFEAMHETIKRTNFKEFKKGDYVNLERAMQLNSRLDGHMVSGHVDTTAKIKEIRTDGIAKIFRIECETDLIAEKGSISINGISLTVSNIDNAWFEVSILPYTLKNTTLQYLKEGSTVNIEYDLIAKYIKKFTTKEETKLTKEFLIENGF